MFHFFGQDPRIIPIPGSAFHDFAGENVGIVGSERKHLCHIHPVILPEHGVGELHAVAVDFVSCGQLHQREVREVVAVYVYQSYFHGLLF